MAKRENSNNPQPGRGNRIQFIGTEAALDKNGPLDMRQSAFPGGTLEMIGTEARLVHKTTPMGEFDKHVRGGMEEWIGSQASLDRTPRRTWQSYESPFSSNSEGVQGDESSFPGTGPRKMMKE